MHATTRRAVLATAVLAVTATASAQQYTIDWYSIDGGGAMFTSGQQYELSGTIGQPDAGAMAGNEFQLVGGFWAAASAGAPCDPCDANCDGAIDAFDVEPFITVLLGGGGCAPCTGDVNGDGVIDAFDIEPFVLCLLP